MLVCLLDTETTGLEPEKGHRIIELAMILMDADDGTVVDQWERRFMPDRSIDLGAERVHGISLEMLSGKPRFGNLVHEIASFIQKSEVIVAHNLKFDAQFLLAEFEKVPKRFPNMQTFCTMENARWATSFGKLPSLRELCYACDVEYDKTKAHAALYDVEVMGRCLRVGLDEGFYSLKSLR